MRFWQAWSPLSSWTMRLWSCRICLGSPHPSPLTPHRPPRTPHPSPPTPQYFLRPSDVGKNRAAACVARLAALNANVTVRAEGGPVTPQLVQQFQVLVATTGTLAHLAELDKLCRAHGVHFICAVARGLFGHVFVDFGDAYTAQDPTGEPTGNLMVDSITQDCPATVHVVEDQRHRLEAGDSVVFSGCKGMEALNDGMPRKVVAVLNAQAFAIEDDGSQMGRYKGGGYVHKVKPSCTVHFSPLADNLKAPRLMCMNGGQDRAATLFAGFKGLDEFQERHGGALPAPESQSHAQEVVLAAHRAMPQGARLASGAQGPEASGNAAATTPAKAPTPASASDGGDGPAGAAFAGASRGEEMSAEDALVSLLASGAQAELAPMVSIVGGIASCEVIKSASGKLMPIHQWLFLDAVECLTASSSPHGHLGALAAGLEQPGRRQSYGNTPGGPADGVVAPLATSSGPTAPLSSAGVDESRHYANGHGGADGSACGDGVADASQPNIGDGSQLSQPPAATPASSAACYSGQRIVFGDDMQASLSGFKCLVAGAGSIGCELLKNLAVMGVATGEHGHIAVVDAAPVQVPHLSNQFLYRPTDVHRPRATVAAAAIRERNPDVKTGAIIEPLAPATDVSDSTAGSAAIPSGPGGGMGGPPGGSLLTDSFFEPLSVLLGGLEDASSRMALDAKSISFRKAYLDGGVSSLKGSVQTVVPFLTEPYSNARDPPERDTPICTLRNFPYAPEHAVAWAAETFDALFRTRPANVNAYLGSRDWLDKLAKATATRSATLEGVRDALTKDKPLSFKSCVEWARLMFEDLFANGAKQMLHNFPPDMKTVVNTPFWSGHKRPPTPLSFDSSNPTHLDFILAAANLQAGVYGLCGSLDRGAVRAMADSVAVPHFEPMEGVKIAVTDSEARGQPARGGGQVSAGDQDQATFDRLVQETPAPVELVGYRLTPLTLDCDDDTADHLNFIFAASKLRALNYGIPLMSRHEARILAGKVTPSLVPAASVVAGLMCLELYKLAAGTSPLPAFRNRFLNLALPLHVHAAPVPVARFTVERLAGSPLVWNLWDRFSVDGRGMTLAAFLEHFKLEQGLEVTMASYGKSLVYAEFMRKKMEERLPLPLIALVEKVAKAALPKRATHITLSVSCTDAHGEDVEVPDVRIRVR
eukprot:jgi/Mesvir1/6212/Mv00893-RA.2